MVALGQQQGAQAYSTLWKAHACSAVIVEHSLMWKRWREMARGGVVGEMERGRRFRLQEQNKSAEAATKGAKALVTH